MNHAASPGHDRWLQSLVLLALVLGMLAMALFGLAGPCAAVLGTLQLRELPSSQVIFQSQQTVVDQAGQPWDITVYKGFRSSQGGELSELLLGIRGADGVNRIDLTVPLQIIPAVGPPWILTPVVPRASLDLAATAFDGQYSLNSIWPTLAAGRHLTLTFSLQNGQTTALFMDSDRLNEWQAVASCQALLCNTAVQGS